MNNGKSLIYAGFSILGGVSCAIYGFTANRFQDYEIFYLTIGGVIGGIALGMIVYGIITTLKK